MWDGIEAYSESECLKREIYSYMGVSAPSWAMQALLRCADNLAISVVEAKLPTTWDIKFPKCWEAFPYSNTVC